MTFRDYAQGAYRMRGIATGQRLNVLVVKEVEQVIERELNALPESDALQALGSRDDSDDSDDSDSDQRRQRLAVDQRVLAKIVCWLMVSSVESEMKQFSFLTQQDLAGTYRKHSLEQLLSLFKADDKLVEPEAEPGPALDNPEPEHQEPEPDQEEILIDYDVLSRHLKSFREALQVDVPCDLGVTRGFRDTLKAMEEEHTDCITDHKMVKLINERVEALTKSEGGSSNDAEQEQEQEEEKEQQVQEYWEPQPIMYSDLAFSRDNEDPIPWSVAALGSEKMAGLLSTQKDKSHKKAGVCFIVC